MYSNFSGKQELFMAAFERHCDQDLAQVQALLATEEPLEQQLDAVTRRFGNLDPEHRQWWLLSMELWLYAQRDPTARERMVALRRKVRQTIADALQRQAARTGRPLPVPASELATVMLGLWQGLMLQRLTDPDTLPPQTITAALAWLRSGAGQTAGRRLRRGGRPRPNTR